MNITTFNPMIVTAKVDDVVKLFEELGFEKTHAPVTDTGHGDITSYRMKHPSGFNVDVADVKQVPQDNILIRMNVDNYQEAYDILIANGFKNTRGDGSVETESAKAATMVSPSGFSFSLIEHKKD